MSRHILIREPDSEGIVVPEGSLPSEAQLHRALAAHPELIPTADLGLGRSVVVGTEARLHSGRADVVLLDERGNTCIVEVKKEGNPDTRRVVAQVLDYAASLWRLSVEEFEARTLERDDDRDLVALIGEELAQGEGDDHAAEVDRILGALEGTLSNGSFVMAIAAPSIPADVQRVIDFLGHQGHRLYGLEYSYFQTEDREIFVPRVVVGPPPGERSPSSRIRGGAIDQETLLARLQDQSPSAAAAAQGILSWADGSGGFTSRFTGTAGVIEKAGVPLLKIWPTRPDRPLEVCLGRLRRYGEPWDEDHIEQFAQDVANVHPRLALGGRRWPRVPLEPLDDDGIRNRFLSVIERAGQTLVEPR